MKKYEVVMHIFAHEMHDFQRLTEQLKRCLSFVDTIVLSTTLDNKDCSIVYRKSGLPFKIFMFLLGMPFEPPLAGIIDTTLIYLYFTTKIYFLKLVL